MAIKRKRCFVIQQIGEPRSPERAHANAVLSKIIRPAARKLGYVAKRIDEVFQLGRISEDIIESLGLADLAIADLEGKNLNVMYELGVRQAWNLPVILIAPDLDSLPFDIRDINTLSYGDPAKTGDADAARRELERRVSALEREVAVPRVFKDMLRKASEPFQMDALRRAASLAMRDLVAALRSRIREVEEETDCTSDEAFLSLREMIREPFKSLRDKKHVLAGVAEDAGYTKLAKRLKGVGVGRLIKKGDSAARMLLKSPRTSATLARVGKCLEAAKDLAQEECDALSPDRQ